jgi:spermidine synthase
LNSLTITEVSDYLSFPIRSDKFSLRVRVDHHLLHRRTEFQTIDVYETDTFGRILLLDGHVQLSEFDEHAYHEGLVQIPLLALENPTAALVVGGGDGGVIRELCRCSSLQRIDMVEIDRGVIEACREILPGLSDGAFDDPRVTVHVQDASPFVKSCQEKYDLIIVDSTDTYEEEQGALSEMLFTAEFYADCKRLLTEGGFVVTQADNPVFCPYSLASISQLFQTVFPRIGTYRALVPSFGGFSAFAWGSGAADVHAQFRPSPGHRYLTPETYALAFSGLSF